MHLILCASFYLFFASPFHGAAAASLESRSFRRWFVVRLDEFRVSVSTKTWISLGGARFTSCTWKFSSGEPRRRTALPSLPYALYLIFFWRKSESLGLEAELIAWHSVQVTQAHHALPLFFLLSSRLRFQAEGSTRLPRTRTTHLICKHKDKKVTTSFQSYEKVIFSSRRKGLRYSGSPQAFICFHESLNAISAWNDSVALCTAEGFARVVSSQGGESWCRLLLEAWVSVV